MAQIIHNVPRSLHMNNKAKAKQDKASSDPTLPHRQSRRQPTTAATASTPKGRPLGTLLLALRPGNVIFVLDRHTLGHVVDLVHAHQSRRELKHVVSEGNDDELGVLGSLLDVICHNGHLYERICQWDVYIRTEDSDRETMS